MADQSRYRLIGTQSRNFDARPMAHRSLRGDDSVAAQQVQNNIEAVLSKVDFELVVQGEIRQAEKRAAVHEVDNINTPEVLLDIKHPPARDAGGMGEQRIIHPAMRHQQHGLPVVSFEQVREEATAAFIYLPKALATQIGFIPVLRRVLKKRLNMVEYFG